MKVINLSAQSSIVNEYLRELRDVHIQSDRMRFRRNLARVAQAMGYEMSKTLTYQPQPVETPLETTTMSCLKDEVVLATILRAGIPFFEGFLECFDKADCAFLSAKRVYTDEAHTQVKIECGYKATPALDGKTLIIVDPMLATGGSMCAGLDLLLENGTPKRIIVAGLIAVPEAVKTLEEWEKNGTELVLYTAAMDERLNEHQYILPGLGDAGDLCFGEKC